MKTRIHGEADMKHSILGMAALAATVVPSLLIANSSLAGIALCGHENVVVVEQEIKGITPEMLDWWWDNINTIERYQLWHPSEHVAFQWLTPPANPDHLDYSIGATHLVTDRIGGVDMDANITWMDPADVQTCVTHDHWIVAQTEFAGFEDISEPGWTLHEYSTNEAGDGILLRTSFVVPGAVAAMYPGYEGAYATHIEQAMQNLPEFLPVLFQKEFVEGELLTRGRYEVFHSGFLTKTVVVDQEIKGITPDMLDWWWNNINTTRRYRQWHPTAHVSFKWLKAPTHPDQLEYSVGAVQQVSEYLGRYKSNLVITWLDPAGASDKVTYDHWLYAKTELKGLRGVFPQRLIHEYTLNNTGDGILMRSTFTIPSFFDFFLPGFSRELARHAQQEMQFLQYFLPELFQAEYLMKDI